MNLSALFRVCFFFGGGWGIGMSLNKSGALSVEFY